MSSPLNVVANLKVAEADSLEGPQPAMVMGLTIRNPATLGNFLSTVGTDFCTKRMLAPPDTHIMIVSIIGDVTSAEFIRGWQQTASANPLLSFFMSRMTRAEVVHATESGSLEILDSGSLLEGHTYSW